jgi:hypothetical protein
MKRVLVLIILGVALVGCGNIKDVNQRYNEAAGG